ncbi:hypothetical protein Bbelb_158670 [Branchiostoma belcheri]|nr:hypothetical protein Bbelb_158670 [Branchiostoma belcheri]
MDVLSTPGFKWTSKDKRAPPALVYRDGLISPQISDQIVPQVRNSITGDLGGLFNSVRQTTGSSDERTAVWKSCRIAGFSPGLDGGRVTRLLTRSRAPQIAP